MSLLASAMAAVAVAIATGLALGPLRRSRPRRSEPLRRWQVPRARWRWALVGLAAGYGFTSSALPAVAGAGGMWWLQRSREIRSQAANIQARQQAWPEALRQIVASTRSGASLGAAFDEVAATGPAGLRAVLSGWPKRVALLGFTGALAQLGQTAADPATDRVVAVLRLAHARGGPIVPEVLEELADSISADLLLLEEARVASHEHRLNARIVAAVPWLVLAMLIIRQGPYRDFYSSGTGAAVLAAGGIASAVGMALVSKLGRDPSEPRVLHRRSAA